MSSWKVTAFADRETVQAALAMLELADWDSEIAVNGFEIADDRPEDWQLDAYLPRRPTKADRAAISGLFGEIAPDLSVEKLPEEDWLTLSQQGVAPIRAGRFHVHTPDYPAEADAVNFAIPASQAFGTGQHHTTAGCLAMLDAMKRRGVIARNLADIGTGTGLLAFAAMKLWPAALATATDIDPVCDEVVRTNAALNAIPLGAGSDELLMMVADGMDHPLLEVRGPFDLLIANILARPLIELAPDFADAVVPGGSVVLAGLLETQEAAVRHAYRLAGFRLAARIVRGDWSILWLRRRAI